MKAARLYGPNDLCIEDVDPPSPGPGEALVRIHACGVCPSDVRGYRTGHRGAEPPLPSIPGHEWVGTVDALGPPLPPSTGAGPASPAGIDISPLQVGDRVVADWRVVCGHCYQCRRGVFNYCEALQRKVRGGFAEYGVGPAAQFRRLPDHLSFDEATFCEPLACILNAHAGLRIDLGDDVVVVGAGPIGLLHLQVALKRGARVIVSDPLPARLALARQLGAHQTIDTAQEDPVARVQALTDGRGADCVIVAVGAAEALRQGLASGAINARVNFFAGTYPPIDLALDPNLIHYRQLVLTGSHDYSPHQFSAALKLLSHRIVQVTPLISHRFALPDVREAFETTANRVGLKVIVCTAP